jgi:hypothetical protein
MENEEMADFERSLGPAIWDDKVDLVVNCFGDLPGKWMNCPPMEKGRKGDDGWNMIALPFKDAPSTAAAPYRVLMNRYEEELFFKTAEDNVPNRGVAADQFVAALDYEQAIKQIEARDEPSSTVAGGDKLPIHHEPGLFIRVKDKDLVTEGLNIARLGTIPHGNSFLALGNCEIVKLEDGKIPKTELTPINGFPLGRFEDHKTTGYDVHDDPYLDPYKQFLNNPFHGFDLEDMTKILRDANQGLEFESVVKLSFDTKIKGGAINNMPFTKRVAEPVSMRSTFWIQRVKREKSPFELKCPRIRMQYVQVVMLNFFAPREDGFPGRATWPHISINTLEKRTFPFPHKT